MDAKHCMIVDLEREGDKRMFITEQVAVIKTNDKGHWTVRFSSSPRVFQYNRARLLYLVHPKTIELGKKGLYINNKRINDAVELLHFTDNQYSFYRVTYANGYTDNFEGRNIYITRTPIDVCGGPTWDYLRKLADETGLQVEEEEKKKNILSRQYAQVDVQRDNVPLAQYLGSKTKLSTYQMPKQLYYPFGCNASQKAAVEAALTHQASIIQGPPGTGKTQTILNIIANLLLANKTVLVVSNNNSAVKNVAEKLQHEGLGFMVAQLGSMKNKQAFIEQQVPYYPNMKDWIAENMENSKKLAADALHLVSQNFDDQAKHALLKAEYNSLLTEKRYNNLLKVSSSQHTDWLNGKPSGLLMKLLNLCQIMVEHDRRPSLWFRLKWLFIFGRQTFSFLKDNLSDVITSLEHAYYEVRKLEIEQELATITNRLQTVNIKQNLRNLTTSSLQILKNKVAQCYGDGTRPIFTLRDIKTKSESFLTEYPVVLSTTYSAKSCISKDMVFDYVIMDEASQVDIKTGALALSCAMNVVIVGDDKQLPNVVSREETLALDAIRSSYHVDDCYNAVTHSFLQSCIELFKEAPITLLREHYRCHPKIIEFCNQRFYNCELVIMTKDSGEKDVLRVVRTVKGNHARERFNQREVDVIVKEIMPQYSNRSSIGIITPYKDQAQAINKALGQDIASTVHKYQGRECDTIIMSTVDNMPTEFSDDANLLNVAISRAKKHLCIITTENKLPEDSNLGQLIDYIQYNNFEIKESGLRSIFDILYQQYTAERLAYRAEHPLKSDYLSETLVYDTITQAIHELQQTNMSVVCHYPLSKLIMDRTALDQQERTFVESPLAHVDFLVYNSITKRPHLTIEVDGWHFHKTSAVQQSRDTLKDQILTKYNLPLLRILTTEIVTVNTIKAVLSKHHSIT